MGGVWLSGQDHEDWTRLPWLALGPPLATCPLGGPQALSPPVKQERDCQGNEPGDRHEGFSAAPGPGPALPARPAIVGESGDRLRLLWAPEC